MSRKGTYVKRRWTVENTWTCDSCKEVNRGRDMKCKKCGSYKEKHEKYDTSKNLTSAPVTDPELLKLAKAGPNWSCSFCKNDVRNKYGECSVCGGPKTDAAVEDWHTNKSDSTEKLADHLGIDNEQYSKFVEGPKKNKPVDDLSDVDRVIETGNFESKPPQYSFSDEEKLLYAKIGAGLAGLGLLVFLLFWLFSYHSKLVTVTNTYWSHRANLSQRSTHHDTGWQDDEPASHFNDVCETRQHGTHDCNPYDCNPHSVSYECNCHSVSDGESCHESCHSSGNGFSECEESCTPQSHTECDSCSRTEYDTCYEQCPTMEQWCSYDYYQWTVIATSELHGFNDHNLRDPQDLVAQRNEIGPQSLEIERHYSVTFTDLNDDEKPHWEYNPETGTDFNRFNTNALWDIEVNYAGQMNILHAHHGH